jgi:hypothetical protein
VEVIVASTVLLTAIVAVGSQLGTQFLSVSTSADQQQAAALLNQAMEEVRALPYTFVANGLSLSDLTAEHPADSNILINGTSCTTNNTTIWPTTEAIPCAAPANETQAPFVPHVSSTTSAGITFDVAAYPSIDAADTGSGLTVYRVTVIVSWDANHGLKQVVAQTLVFSAASGCITQTNHPFAAPCQPFLYSTASAGGGYINVTPDSQSSNPPVAGDPFNSVELLFPQVSSDAEIEQVSTVLGSALTSEGTINSSSLTQDIGGVSSSISADNDPGTARSPNSPGTLSQSATSPALQLPTTPGLDANVISVQPSSGDSGSLVATTDATGSPACYDLLGISQLTNLPCGSGKVAQSGANAALDLNLFAGTASLGTAPLGTVAAQPSTIPDETFVGRYAPPTSTSGGSYCPSTPSNGDGCVHAGAQEALGAVEVGGLPSQFLSDGAAPAAWGAGAGACPSGAGNNNYVLAVVNYSARASSESGVSPGSPSVTVPASGAPTPTLCYWSGAGYTAQAINWGTGSPPSVSMPTVTATDGSIASGAVTVTITTTLQLVPATTATNIPSGCSSVCTSSASVPSLVQASILYVVTQGSSTLADMDIKVSLGQVLTNTSYQAAP